MSGFVQRWWRGEAGTAGVLLDAALWPAELGFRAAAYGRNVAFDRGLLARVRVDLPVVSIGNILVGGAGKTPFAAHVARMLSAQGHTPALLHGGYADDEPVLHRQWNPQIPVIVGRDRVAAAREAIETGASVILLDDGFQHRRLARDLDLVLVAAETWTRTPRLLPRGPWREPPTALRRATAIVITARTTEGADARARVQHEVEAEAPGVPVCVAHMAPERWQHAAAATSPRSGASQAPPPGPAIAVAAIAHPELFLRGARAAGAEVEALIAFRDHHDYDEADAERIRARAGGRAIVTTEKDWVKLSAWLDHERVWVLGQNVTVTHGADTLEAQLAALPRTA